MISFLTDNHLIDNIPELPTALVVLLCIGAIILLGVGVASLIFAFRKEKSTKGHLLDFNIRVYRYDYGSKTYFFFDQNDIGNQKTYNESQFINQFAPSDRYRVQNWLDKISKSDGDYPRFLQADIKISKKANNTITSMLELTSVNHESNIIHFESHLLPYLGSANELPKKVKNTQSLSANLKKEMLYNQKKIRRYFVDDSDDAQKFIDSADSSQTLGFLYLKLYRQGGNIKNDETYLAEINEKVLTSLYHFMNKSIRLLKVSPTETLFIDKDSKSKPMVMNMASSINTAVTQFLNFSVTDMNLFLAVGVTFGSLCKRDIALAISQSGDMAKAISNNYSSEKILLYDPTFFQNYHTEQKNLSDVHMVIKNSTYRLYYLPSLNTKSWEQSFFFLNVVPFGTELKDISKLLEVARKINEGTGPYQFYCSVQKKVAFTMKNVKNNGVAIEVPYKDIKSFLQAMKDTESKINWVVQIKETDLLAYMDDQVSIKRSLQSVIQAGYKIGIILFNANSALPGSILKTASYFIVGDFFTSRLIDPKVRNDLRLIQGNYNTYNALLTYYHLENDNSFELAVHYGGRIIQCNSLSAPSSRPAPLDEERIEELKEATKDLIPKARNSAPMNMFNRESFTHFSLPDLEKKKEEKNKLAEETNLEEKDSPPLEDNVENISVIDSQGKHDEIVEKSDNANSNPQIQNKKKHKKKKKPNSRSLN